MSKVFLPGFDIASGHNRRLVINHETDIAALSLPVNFHGSKTPDHAVLAKTAADVEKKKPLARYFGALTLEVPNSPDISSWTQLKQHAYSWLALEHHPYAGPGVLASEGTPAKREKTTRKLIRNFGRDAVSSTVAFLEVNACVLAPYDLENPNNEIAEHAFRSRGFITEWSGLHHAVDIQLAYALAQDKPEDPADVFMGDLQFEPYYFSADTRKRLVGLDPEKAKELKGSTGKHPSDYQPNPSALFGCPAIQMIPALYKAICRQAFTSRLFEQTYLEQRAA